MEHRNTEIMEPKRSETEQSFTWSLPSVPYKTKELLCHGWTRNNYKHHIISGIVNLFIEFYSCDLFTLNDIKDLNDNSKKYFSLIFTMYHDTLKFYLD